MPTVQIALYVVLGIAMAICAVTDVKSRLIYNAVTYPTILLALAIRGGLGGLGHAWGGWGLLSGLIGLAVGFGLFFIMMLMGGMMGGDVKLMGAAGAVLGAPLIIYALMFTALVGGLEAILVLLWQGSLLDTFKLMGRKVAHGLHLKRMDGPPPAPKYVPYGVAIALGCVWTVVYEHLHPLMDSVGR